MTIALARPRPRLAIPSSALNSTPPKGYESVAGLLTPIPEGGATARGYSTRGDIVTQTRDGVDLNQIWDEFQQSLELHNQERQRLIQLLTFGVSQPIERIPQMSGGDLFEEASEFGEPQGIRVTPEYWTLGYDFRWYDLAIRYTWKFLADATQSQVEALNNLAINADNELLFKRVMQAVFDNRTRQATIYDDPINVYPFYNGDGVAPPDYKNNTFDSTHNHYVTTGSTPLVGRDLVDLYRLLTEHGYGDEPGMSVIILANETEVDTISGFRADGTDDHPHDFLPVSQDFARVMERSEEVQGEMPPTSIRDLEVAGRYGKSIIVRENFIPSGYLVGIVSAGEDSVQNPVGIREHENADLRGLRLIKGRDDDYPLVDSYYGRAFGTGVRHRGAGAVMEITTNADYTRPPEYERST